MKKPEALTLLINLFYINADYGNNQIFILTPILLQPEIPAQVSFH